MSDLVAVWEVSLSDGLHLVEFEHGTTTGKRVIRVDGKVKIKFEVLSDARNVMFIMVASLLVFSLLVKSC